MNSNNEEECVRNDGSGLLVALVVLTAIAVFFNIYVGYQMNYDIDAYIDRAQVAADREDMLEYMQKVKEGLEKWDATSGNTALIFRTPGNDLGLLYKTLGRVIERLESIADIPKNETAYQVALDDLRGTIREVPNPTEGILWVRYTWWMLLFLGFGWLLWIRRAFS